MIYHNWLLFYVPDTKWNCTIEYTTNDNILRQILSNKNILIQSIIIYGTCNKYISSIVSDLQKQQRK